MKDMILFSHPKRSSRMRKLGPFVNILLLILFLSIHNSSGQGAEIVYGIGIKLCKLKCIERGGCLIIAYNADKLACHLWTWMDCTKQERNIPYSKQGNKFPAASCTLMTCTLGTRCVERRRGGAVCIEVPSPCDFHTGLSMGKFEDVNCQQWIGKRLAMWAVGGGHRELVELLVSKRTNVKHIDSFNIKIFHSACLLGDTEVVNYVLSQRTVDINDKGRCGRTGVMLAAENGQKDVVELLVDKGADVSLVDRTGGNILHCASIGGDTEVVNHILSKNMVDINSIEQRKKTPVMLAGQNGHVEVVHLFVKHGAYLSLRDKSRNSILHLACWKGHLGVVKYIMSLGTMAINSRGYEEKTPIMYAAQYGHKAVVDLLVKKRANLFCRDKSGNNILHLACWEGHLDVVKYMVSIHKLDINSGGWGGKTPVVLAGKRGRKEVVEFLVNHGASLSTRDDAGNTILHPTCWEGHLDVVKYITSLHRLDINSGGHRKRTPVMFAGFGGHKELVEFLVKQGADLSLRSNDKDNILHYTSYGGSVDVMQYVLSLNTVNINSREMHKRTAVMIAGMEGHKGLVELFVKHGASLSLTDKEGNNILHLASSKGHFEVVRYILSLGIVNINVKNKRGHSAVRNARRHRDVVDLLLSHGAHK